MRRYLLNLSFCFCLTLSLLVGCGGDDDTVGSDNAAVDKSTNIDLTHVHEMAPGMTYTQTLQTSEKEGIRFGIHVPTTYDSDEPAPLVLSLHPGGNNGPDFGAKTIETFTRVGLAELDSIVLGPDSHGEHWKNPEVEKRVMKLLEETIKAYNIDESKIIVLGYSMGAQGAWHLAGKYPELFSAVIAVSGRVDEDATEEGWSIPAYVIHSREDEIMPFERTRQAVEQLQVQGAPITLEVIDGVSHFESAPFIEPLRQSVPWLEQIWENSAGQ